MAFILNKSKIQSVFQVKIKTPGPGTYQNKIKTCEQIPAPFNSSTNKTSYFDVQQTKYGPGSYDPDKIKIKQHKKIPINSSFKSKVQRFKTYKTQPQQKNKKNIQCKFAPQKQKNFNDNYKSKSYNRLSTQSQHNNSQKKNYLQDFRKTNYSRKVNSIHNNKEFVRVILSNPNNTQMNASVYVDKQTVVKTEPGPGKYYIQTKHKQISIIAWSNDKEKRFKKSKSVANGPGPGQYELSKQDNKNIHKSTSSFSFGGVRSFMDQIIYRTNIPIKAKILEFKQIKDRYPGPGEYSPQKVKNESFYCGDQILGSGAQRFKNHEMNIPGPGHYKQNRISHDFTKTMREERKKIFGKQGSLIRKTSQTQNVIPLIMQNEDRKKAQDQRLRNYCSLKQRCSSKYGSLGQEERFKDIEQVNHGSQSNQNKNKSNKKVKGTPGPGTYQVQKNIKVQNKYQSVFKSGLDRQVFKGEKQQIQLPFYNIQKHDIGNKAKRIKNNIQNLKRVFIQMVPFNSSVKRFSTQDQNQYELAQHNKSESLKDNGIGIKNLPLEGYKTKNTFGDKSNSTYNRTTHQKKCSASFKSSSNREPFISQSYINLGPGSYQNCTSLDKKSFNSQYNEELVRRMNIYGPPRSRTSLK